MGDVVSFNQAANEIQPKFVIECFEAGLLRYIEAHRLIVSCCEGEYLEMWSIELIHAYDRCQLLLELSTAVCH